MDIEVPHERLPFSWCKYLKENNSALRRLGIIALEACNKPFQIGNVRDACEYWFNGRLKVDEIMEHKWLLKTVIKMRCYKRIPITFYLNYREKKRKGKE